jgi:hypothetical protein
MNKILIALVFGTAAAAAQAGDRDRHRHDHDRGRDRGYAEVVFVEPIHERVR